MDEATKLPTKEDVDALRRVASGETRPTYTDLARALTRALEYADALSAVPEDVARDYATAHAAMRCNLVSVSDKQDGQEALSRLAAAAARVPGLEARLREWGQENTALLLRVRAAESERDAWKLHALNQRALLSIYNGVVQDLPQRAQELFGAVGVGAVAAHLLNTEPEATTEEKTAALLRYADILAEATTRSGR